MREIDRRLIEGRLAALREELVQGQEESTRIDRYLEALDQELQQLVALAAQQKQQAQERQVELHRSLDMTYGSIQTLEALLQAQPAEVPITEGLA